MLETQRGEPSVVGIQYLPLTPNGKVDRTVLSAPDQCHSALEMAYVAPRTAAEETLAQLWGQVLGLEQVGVQDDFFVLGGHSLLATQLISRVREVFHVELSLRCLFDAPTVADFATEITRRLSGQSGSDASTIDRITGSSIQQLLAQLDQLSEDDVDALLNEMVTGEAHQ